MKSIVGLAILVLGLAPAGPRADAGEPGKCPLSAQDCLDLMAGKLQRKGWLGVEIQEEAGRMKITKILAASPAEKAGLAAGDVLVAMNGLEYTEANAESLAVLREEMTPGRAFLFTVLKAGAEQEDVQVTLSAIPPDLMAQLIGKHLLDHVSAGKDGK